MKTKIIRSSKREFDCLDLESKQEYKAVALREIVKKEHPVVGDNVLIRPQDNDDRFEIYELEKRENEIFRKIVRSNKKKVIAANVDLILVVASVSKPDYKPYLIDRYIARATQWEIPLAVIFNKMDEFEDQFDIEYQKKKMHALGIETIEASNDESSEYFQNLIDLKERLKGKTTICLGQSGVGKSKIISTLSQGKIELLSNRLAKKVNKGAHTTTWAEIVDLDDFLMIDSPGVRTLSIQDMSLDDLIDCFPDLIPWFQKCKFKDCKHQENSKGCSFHSLDLDNEEDYLVIDRLYSYLKMKEEIEAIPEWQR